jgi:hypothetical protein
LLSKNKENCSAEFQKIQEGEVMNKRHNIVNILTVLWGFSMLTASPAWSQRADSETSTIFTTNNWLDDREHWDDPAYYRNSTPNDINDMGGGSLPFGVTGDISVDIPRDELISPYPFQTSDEHYQTWLEAADGGTQHTRETLPDWSGWWGGGDNWLEMHDVQASTIVTLLTPQYQEYYVEQLKAEAEARAWWPAAFCLPEGVPRLWATSVGVLFQVTPQAVSIIHPNLSQANIALRWIETSGEGHSPEEEQNPNFMGESIGFWDGDMLVVHTDYLKGWMHGHGELEYSDELTLVERYQRIGDNIEAEITLYDPVAFVEPLHAKATLEIREAPAAIPWSHCTSSIGPSRNTYFDADGYLQQRFPNDPEWWNPTEQRPWVRAWQSMPLEAAPPAEFID